ncbi:MAG: glutamine synthetase [Clostridiales bacterium]|nr:glutamine synthetase [Clostridiales bacterium]
MDYTRSEVLQYVAENDVKFIRLAFCDIFGTMKNLAILADELPRAFETGISFDASSLDGFMNEEQDLLLFPDPGTLKVLPWRPQQGRVVRFYCDIRRADGTPFEGDGRYVLKKAVEAAAQMGYECQVGSECEFYLFEADERGCPTKIPHDRAGYLDIAPADKGENVRREICLTLEAMGIQPESSHHEHGPGQNEIDFKYSDALSAADNLTTFKSVVKTMAARNGLYASFMPKPLEDEGGSGMHINLSLNQNGQNIFKDAREGHCAEAESFMAGIMRRIAEMTLFLNPLTNSYARFGQHEAPQYITWSRQNRSPLIRIPSVRGEWGSRMELRSADCACNPYLAFSVLLYAGLEGIRDRLALEEPLDQNVLALPESRLKALAQLPSTLKEAADKAKSSEFLQRVLPESILRKFIFVKEMEWQRYCKTTSKERFERQQYFERI